MLDKWLLVCGGFYYGTDTYTENRKNEKHPSETWTVDTDQTDVSVQEIVKG